MFVHRVVLSQAVRFNGQVYVHKGIVSAPFHCLYSRANLDLLTGQLVDRSHLVCLFFTVYTFLFTFLAVLLFLWYYFCMKILLILIFVACIIWPIVCWFSYHMAWWRYWEQKFARKQTNFNTLLATSVGLKKFGTYNLCVSVGVEDYGVLFAPSRLLFFHHTFSIPWANIISFQMVVSHASTRCILNTNAWQIVIKGDIAEIVGRGCQSHYVVQINR